MPIDVQAKRYYAAQRAIIDRYRPFIGQLVGCISATNSDMEERMWSELNDLE